MSMYFHLDNNSTLSHSRKHPPLPRASNPQEIDKSAIKSYRPSMQQHVVRRGRNISNTSFRSENHRRSLQRVPSKERQTQIYQPEPDREQQINKQVVGTDAEIANELVRILRDQNENLKEQNDFLVATVRELHLKEKSLRQAVKQYEVVVTQLQEQNKYLKRQVANLTDDAKRRVDQFGRKLSILLKERRSMESLQNGFDHLNIESRHRVDNYASEQNVETYVTQTQDFNHYISTNTHLNRSKPEINVISPSKSVPDDDHNNLIDDLNNQFEALIYSCRVEKNAEKRKEIRKRLVDLTYQMRALGGNTK